MTLVTLRKLAMRPFSLVTAPVRIVRSVAAQILPAGSPSEPDQDRQTGAVHPPADHRPETSPSPNDTPEPADQQVAVPAAERTRVAEQLLQELEEVPAGELADAPEDTKQDLADLRAKHLAEEYEAEQARNAQARES